MEQVKSVDKENYMMLFLCNFNMIGLKQKMKVLYATFITVLLKLRISRYCHSCALLVHMMRGQLLH